ncbi:unnamed protein product [Hymenolepis diminuta]|uniref:Protein cornichon homolog 2 n=1 Tax=Hymenolepis diminuta TaxID=6216 RepID=A0A0R3SS37_HYMDI|nr:unnamed protein product [Hymenolepis diminuta]
MFSFSLRLKIYINLPGASASFPLYSLLMLSVLCCTGVAIFHLAYLAVMFDTSEQQDKGYDMFHVLKKWSSLNFLSHIVAALTYLLSFLL